MRLERTMTTSESEKTAHEITATYLQRLGYKQISGAPYLAYGRGSALGSLISTSPKSWGVKAIVNVASHPEQKTVISVSLDVNMVGQLVIDTEPNYWRSELDGLEKAIENNEVDLTPTVNVEKSLFIRNTVSLFIVVGSMIITATGSVLLFRHQAGYIIGSFIGFALGLVISRWLWKTL